MNLLSRIVSLILLFISLPIFIFISLLIYLEDGTPVFYTQNRVGLHNRLFLIYKFRTMKRSTPELATHLLVDPDQYLLRIGKILRKSSLDELPNLINILKGEMLFIGPRPALYNQHDLIDMRTKLGVNKIKPGITGWAQVNGRDELSIEDKVELDKQYLEEKSILFDVRILFITLKNVLIGRNVKH